jgi:hypothetical protein
MKEGRLIDKHGFEWPHTVLQPPFDKGFAALAQVTQGRCLYRPLRGWLNDDAPKLWRDPDDTSLETALLVVGNRRGSRLPKRRISPSTRERLRFTFSRLNQRTRKRARAAHPQNHGHRPELLHTRTSRFRPMNNTKAKPSWPCTLARDANRGGLRGEYGLRGTGRIPNRRPR